MVDGSSTVMRLMRAHVPVTLLVDLLCPPDADEVYAHEGGATDWLADMRHGRA
jgi:hypothetical protein